MIIQYEDLKSIRKENADKKIVMLKGTFDLFHIGHLNMIRRAKALGDILVVLVKCDEAIKLKGPDRPIVDETQRAAIVDSIRFVDYTLIADRKIDAGIADIQEKDRMQYLRYYKLVSELRPDVLIKPSKKLPEVLLDLYNEIGTSIYEAEETPGVSTTILINKIRENNKDETTMKVAIGQDSHRFDESGSDKPLILGGVVFENDPPLEANSDGDVVLHAVTRAISGITTIDVLGPKTKEFLSQGITDSRIYLAEALKDLDGTISHLSVSIECKRPHITKKIPEMRSSLAGLLHTSEKNIGITATSGEGLTEFGKGNGISVFAVITIS